MPGSGAEGTDQLATALYQSRQSRQARSAAGRLDLVEGGHRRPVVSGPPSFQEGVDAKHQRQLLRALGAKVFIPISTRSAPMGNQAEVNHPLSGNIAPIDQDSFKI